VQHVAALAKRAEVPQPVVGRVAVQVPPTHGCRGGEGPRGGNSPSVRFNAETLRLTGDC
jgi:hypothetical protein